MMQQNSDTRCWSVFVQPVPRMLNLPRNNPSMISPDAAGPSSSNARAFAGASNMSAPALLPAYQAPPAPHVVYSAQAPAPGLPPVHQQQQPVALYDLSNMVAPPAAAVPTMAATSGHQPPQFALNQQQQHDMFAPRRQGGWMRRRHETTGPVMLSFQQPPAADPFMPMAGGGRTFGASPTGATDPGAYGDVAMAHLQSPSFGAQPEPAESFDDVLRRTMMEMDDKLPRSNYANCSAEALMGMAPPATDELAAMVSGKRSNYNAGPFMVTDVDGGNSASFMAPQDDLPVPTGKQVELGAPDIHGSPLGSPEPSAMFNGNGDMAAMFSSDQYDENAMFSLDALWDFGDDVPMHPEGQQQVAAADSTAGANATGIIPDGGASGSLGPNWNMGAADDDGLDIMEDLLRKDNADDFQLLPQDMNNSHQ